MESGNLSSGVLPRSSVPWHPEPNDWDTPLRQLVGPAASSASTTKTLRGLITFAESMWQQLLREDAHALRLPRLPRTNGPHPLWISHLLLESSHAKTEILLFPKQSRFPLHDHPGCWGVMRILSGCLRIRQFDHDPDRIQRPPCYPLQLKSDQFLYAGQYSCFGPEWKNLHEMETLERNVLALNIQTRQHPARQQSLYLSLGLNGDKSQIYQRVIRRPADQAPRPPGTR